MFHILQIAGITVGYFYRVKICDAVGDMPLDNPRHISKKAYETYLEPPAADDDIRSDDVAELRAVEFIIGTYGRTIQIAEPARKLFQTVVEFMVAEAHHVIFHGIYQVHFQIAMHHGKIGCPLAEVAGIHQKHLPFTHRTAHTVYVCRPLYHTAQPGFSPETDRIYMAVGVIRMQYRKPLGRKRA